MRQKSSYVDIYMYLVHYDTRRLVSPGGVEESRMLRSHIFWNNYCIIGTGKIPIFVPKKIRFSLFVFVCSLLAGGTSAGQCRHATPRYLTPRLPSLMALSIVQTLTFVRNHMVSRFHRTCQCSKTTSSSTHTRTGCWMVGYPSCHESFSNLFRLRSMMASTVRTVAGWNFSNIFVRFREASSFFFRPPDAWSMGG